MRDEPRPDSATEDQPHEAGEDEIRSEEHEQDRVVQVLGDAAALARAFEDGLAHRALRERRLGRQKGDERERQGEQAGAPHRTDLASTLAASGVMKVKRITEVSRIPTPTMI